jgi:metal-responsive CopG/Arc/MetJ family transcriptional regulator
MPKQKKTEMVLMRFSPDDLAAVDKAAEAEDMTRSEYIRAALLAYMALRMNKHALGAVLTGAKNILKELEEEGRRQFFSKKVKAG